MLKYPHNPAISPVPLYQMDSLPMSLSYYSYHSVSVLKGRMILRCVKKAISYRCPYVIAIVVPYQIHTVVMMTIC